MYAHTCIVNMKSCFYKWKVLSDENNMFPIWLNQFAAECMCSNYYGRHGQRPESECDRRCTGNSAQICGAGLRNSVFLIGNSLLSNLLQCLNQISKCISYYYKWLDNYSYHFMTCMAIAFKATESRDTDISLDLLKSVVFF